MKKEYTELEVWQESRKLTNIAYGLVQKYPKDELFGITSQIRRSAVSVPANIAEGCGRRTANDTIQFLHIARGSLYELETQFYISYDQNYISEDELTVVLGKTLIYKKLLNGFINYYKNL